MVHSEGFGASRNPVGLPDFKTSRQERTRSEIAVFLTLFLDVTVAREGVGADATWYDGWEM